MAREMPCDHPACGKARHDDARAIDVVRLDYVINQRIEVGEFGFSGGLHVVGNPWDVPVVARGIDRDERDTELIRECTQRLVALVPCEDPR